MWDIWKKSRGAGATRTRNFIIVYRSHIQTLTNLDQLVKISATKIRYSGGNMCKPLELPSIHELHNINLCNYQSVPMQLLAHFRHVCQHSWNIYLWLDSCTLCEHLRFSQATWAGNSDRNRQLAKGGIENHTWGLEDEITIKVNMSGIVIWFPGCESPISHELKLQKPKQCWNFQNS